METLNKKVSKFQSVQGGPFNTGTGAGQNKHIDMDIPADLGVVSLKDTFIQLRCSMTPVDADQLLHYFLQLVDLVDCPVRNLDLIRNAWMESKNYGRLEDIRRVNVLRHNLMELQEQSSTKLSKDTSLYNIYDTSTLKKVSPFIEVHKNDGFSSRYVDVYLRIPLSDIFELGSVEQLDVQKLGGIRIHVELERKDYFQVNVLETDDVLNYDNETQCEDISGNDQPNQLQITAEYTETSQVPFFVGMPLLVEFEYFQNTSNNPVDASANVIITDIDISKTIDASGISSQYIVTLTIDTNLPSSEDASGNVGNYQDITISLPSVSLPISANNFNVLTCELAVCHYLNVKYNMDMLEWTTWTTEEFTNGNSSLSHIFELEPECANVIVMFANDRGILSHYGDRFTYRMRVDNVDVYDYDIECNKQSQQTTFSDSYDALHYDSLNRLFLNMGKNLKSLMPAYNTSKLTQVLDLTSEDDLKICLLGTPTNLTANQKLLQLVIDNKESNPTAIDNLILFKHVVRTLKL